MLGWISEEEEKQYTVQLAYLDFFVVGCCAIDVLVPSL